jgi:hypothetical protein
MPGKFSKIKCLTLPNGWALEAMLNAPWKLLFIKYSALQATKLECFALCIRGYSVGIGKL